MRVTLTIDGRRITVWHEKPPIPDRQFDYGAHEENDEEGLTGWGPTPEAAIANLREQLED